jgi:hypothetical protein
MALMGGDKKDPYDAHSDFLHGYAGGHQFGHSLAGTGR